MGRKISAALAALTLISIFMVSVYAQAGYRPPHDRPGPATDIIRFEARHVDIAPAEIEAGAIDMYLFSLKTAAAKEMRDVKDVRLIEAPATTLALILNPAPAPDGELNPFSIKEVRLAMQYVVNRRHIADVFFGGLAVPMYTHVSPLDFDYLTVFDIVRELNFRYDPELAKQMIADAMQRAGAELKDGKWMYNGRPVVIKFIIRTEDERRDIGFMVASELEKLGFTVERILLEFGPAILRVYSTDPKTFEWHIYTEGWGRGAVEKYDSVGINQFCAPWFGNMPGWQEVGFWQYENQEIDEIAKRIFVGDFGSRQERDELYRRATTICAEESIRIWLVTVMNSFPVRKEVEGLVTDLVAGPRSIYSLREAYIAGKEALVVGHLWVETPRTTWNPIGGFGDVYSVDIWRYVFDPPVARHPYTGTPIPFRADFEVETAGPGGFLEVPSDAFIWDAEESSWVNVPAGTKARSKVTFDLSRYLSARWHHGQRITMADVLYSIYQAFDISYNKEKSAIETAIAVTSRPFLETFKGFRIVGDNKLEVYVDYWHFEEEFIAEFATPTALSMPWEILASMDSLVFAKRRAAYSDTAATRFNVPWINLVKERHARLLVAELRDFLERGFVPENVFRIGEKSYVSLDEAKERYEAAIEWFKERGHLVISQGPYMLNKFDAAAQFAELVAFRDETYPFRPGEWAEKFGEVETIEFGKVDARSIIIGRDNRFLVELRGPGQLALKYLLFDPASGEVLERGEAERIGEGKFEVMLSEAATSKLSQGIYKLFLVAYSADALGVVSEWELSIEASKEPAREEAMPTQITEVVETKVEEPASWLQPSLIIVAIIIISVVAFISVRLRHRRR